MMDTASNHNVTLSSEAIERMHLMERTRPLIPGIRVYSDDYHWHPLPDLTPLQQASYAIEQSGLPSRLAKQRMNINDPKNYREAYRIQRLRECIDIWLLNGTWTDETVLSWKWSNEALSRCPFQLLSNDEIRALYKEKSIVITGDSMHRELFFGINGALTNKKADFKNKYDMHWTSDDGHTTVDLWRSNFAAQLAHSIDAIYLARVAQPLLGKKNKSIKQSIDAIHKSCAQSDTRWLCCSIKDAPKDTAFFIGGAASWEPRAFNGIYGYYANERDWERYKREEYAVHVERWMDRACSMEPSMVLWRTCNHYIDDASTPRPRWDGDVNYNSRMYELDDIAIQLIDKLRTKRRCNNIFMFDLHHLTARRPDLSSDGRHFPSTTPLFGQLVHNAYRLFMNTSFPSEEPPLPAAVA